jgi:hypothetical protein
MIKTTPTNMISNPTQKRQFNLSRSSHQDAMQTHSGVIFPRIDALATVVYDKDVFHNAKLTAMHIPLTMGNQMQDQFMQGLLSFPRVPRNGNSISVESRRR